jgi:hypothetical protein
MSIREAQPNERGSGVSPGEEGFAQGWVNTLGNDPVLRWWLAEHDRALEFVPDPRDAVDARLREAGPAQRNAHRRLPEQIRSCPLPIDVAAKER